MEGLWPLFCPKVGPSPDLERWLWIVTPRGAPVVPVLLSSVQEAVAAPLLGQNAQSLARTIADRLPVGIHREPGLPDPKRARPRWGIEAAWMHDIRGLSEDEIAGGLGRMTNADRRRVEDGDDRRSRTGRRYVTSGRHQLAELGAWPWTLSGENGMLPARWWEAERFARALAAWHETAFIYSLNDLLVSVDQLGVDQTSRVLADRWFAARDLYRTQVDRIAAARHRDAA